MTGSATPGGKPLRRPRLVRNCARGAGTHNPWRSRLQNPRCNAVLESKVLGVWVPAFAGTTYIVWRVHNELLRIQFSNSHVTHSHSFTISPRNPCEFCP